MLNCAEFEILLAGEIDGTLTADEHSALVRHQESCAACAALAADALEAVGFMERAAEAELPPALVAKILHATESGWAFKLREKGLRGWINRTLAPVLRPRLVMGAMATMMSLTMLTRCAGTPKQTMTAADLDPVRLWSSLDTKAHRIWERGVKSYESMKLVYEIQTQLSEWNQQQAAQDDAAADAKANNQKLPEAGTTVPQTTVPQEKKP